MPSCAVSIFRSEHFCLRKLDRFFEAFSFWHYWLQALKPSAPQPTAASDHDEHEKNRHQAEGKCREHCDYSASRNQGTLGLID